MSPRAASSPARASGPRLGVAREQRVRSAGGRVGQWWTPPWLADELVRWAGVRPGARVLDAGAGEGALSAAALEAGARVVAVERDSRLVEKLRARLGEGPEVAVRHGDFLEADPRQAELFAIECLVGFDVCLTNPPWESDLPERFMLRGLELAHRVCAIVPLNMLCGGKRAAFWQVVRATRVKALAHRPRFLATKGGMRDVMLIEVTRRGALDVGPVRLEIG